MNNNKSIRMLLLLSLLSAFPPLSTDMYLPAIPLLTEEWNQPLSTVNLTLVAFFVTYCFSLLVYGPLSDRFGRKPPLLVGISIYIAASFLCALAGSVYALILFRILQAAGAASASVMAMAISKDIYEGRERQRILAYIGVIMAIAPMLAPVLGGIIMTWFTWPWVFVSQSIVGFIAFAGVLTMKESHNERVAVSPRNIFNSYLHLFNNKPYLGLVFTFSLIGLPHFAFIARSSDIYISGFGLTEQRFSYFFAFNALAIMAGSFSCSRLQKNIDTNRLLSFSFLGMLIGAITMVSQVIPGPWGLALPMAVLSFCFGLSRPVSNNMILEQVEKYAGAASSFMVFIFFMVGAFSMYFISLPWENPVRLIGTLGVLSAGLVLTAWLLVLRKSAKSVS